MFKFLSILLGITLYCATFTNAQGMFRFDRVASMMQDPTLLDSDGNLIEYDEELKFLAQELKDVKKQKNPAMKKYKSKYDIPESVQNYTDARNVTHPIWAKPFFDREYHTFDEIWKTKNGTSEEIYNKFKPQALCLKDCYDKMYKDVEKHNKHSLKLYFKCKIDCYKEQIK